MNVVSETLSNYTTANREAQVKEQRKLCKLCATQILKLGYNLLPGKVCSKSPLVKWKPYTTKRVTRATLEDWKTNPWELNDEPNWLFLCGEKPYNDLPGLVLVDADDQAAIDLVRKRCPHTPLQTYRNDNPNKRHFFYRHPGYHINCRTKTVIDGVNYHLDIKGDGGIAVAPGGRHKDGGSYIWEQPWTRELIESAPLFNPDWLPDEKSKTAGSPGEWSGEGGDHAEAISEVDVVLSDRKEQAKDYLARTPGATSGAGAGAGTYCLAIAGKLLWDYALPQEMACEILYEWGQKSDQTDEHGNYYPWNWNEILHKVHDAASFNYNNSEVGCSLDHNFVSAKEYEVLANVVDTDQWSTPDQKPLEQTTSSNEKPKSNKPKKEGSKKTVTQKLAALALKNFELFHTEDSVPWATTTLGDGHRETFGVNSKQFKGRLSSLYWATYHDAPNDKAMRSVADLCEYKALRGAKEKVYQRVARIGDKIYIDLCNTQWRAVEITKDGWRVIQNDKVKFRRTDNMDSLPVPVFGGSFDELYPLTGCDKEGFVLFKAVVLDAFKGKGPFFATVVTGEQGSAKSTLCEIFRTLVDPLKKAKLSSLPKDEKDLGIDCVNEYLLAYDNVSYLPQDMSDALCRVCTGGGIKCRKLYTDEEQSVFDICNPVCLNGIPDFATANDLLGRSVIIRQPAISDEMRLPKEVVMERFEEMRPRLFGAILNQLVIGLKHIEKTNVPNLPRMADSCKWVTACTSSGEFLRVYRENIEDALELSIEASPVAPWIIRMLSDVTSGDVSGQWTGTATKLLATIKDMAGEHAYEKGFPRNPKTFSDRLRRDAPALREQGITVSYRKSNGAKLIDLAKRF